MRLYRCHSCGRGLFLEGNTAPCKYCGSRQQRKATTIRWHETLTLFVRTRGELIVPPEGTLLERFLLKKMDDQAEKLNSAGGPLV